MRELPSGTVTFLFSDIEGSTKLLDELGTEAYAAALAEHRRVMREAFAAHGGVEVDTQGDAFFVAFPEAQGALAAATQAQEALAAGRVSVRMGIHSGEPLLTDEGYVGIDVHRGARVMSTGHGGQVLVSEATFALLDGADNLTGLGRHRLKDLTEPQPLYQLGQGDFPPLKTLYQTNLPVQPTPLVGRESELAEVLELLSSSRLLTLTGAGGSGKTRLALQAAAELVGEYKDGVWWVSLAALRDPALVEPTIAQVVGAKNGLAEHLRDKQALLLLDNFEQLLEAALAIAHLLSEASDVRVLTTSRERLGLRVEQEYEVPILVPAEAVALFTARARQLKVGFEPDEHVEEICRGLDGLPLAVELAAARVKTLSPEQILERLGRSLDLLTAGSRDAPERQRTLRATIEWSYELLDEAEKELFAGLAVFPGSFDLEAFEAVVEPDVGRLSALVDKSLLRKSEEGRFFMLGTIREFALERLEETGRRDTMTRRHANHFLAFVEGSSERQPIERAQQAAALEREVDNLRAVLAWSGDEADDELNLRLANTLWTGLWGPRGMFKEGLRWLKQGLEPGRAPGPLRLRALNWASAAAMSMGDGKEARALAEMSLTLCRELGDQAGLAHAMLMLGNACYVDGDHMRARTAYEDSRRLFEELGRSSGVASAIHNLGLLDLEAGEYERAKSRFEEALVLKKWRDSISISDLGFVAFLQGRHEDALTLFADALRRSSSEGNTPIVIECLIGLAGISRASGNQERAARLLGSAEALAEDIVFRPLGAVKETQQRTKAVVTSQSEAWAEGRGWSIDAAVEYALSNVDSD